eukprot:747989-Hanusia_phi.AAC.1
MGRHGETDGVLAVEGVRRTVSTRRVTTEGFLYAPYNVLLSAGGLTELKGSFRAGFSPTGTSDARRSRYVRTGEYKGLKRRNGPARGCCKIWQVPSSIQSLPSAPRPPGAWFRSSRVLSQAGLGPISTCHLVTVSLGVQCSAAGHTGGSCQSIAATVLRYRTVRSESEFQVCRNSVLGPPSRCRDNNKLESHESVTSDPPGRPARLTREADSPGGSLVRSESRDSGHGSLPAARGARRGAKGGPARPGHHDHRHQTGRLIKIVSAPIVPELPAPDLLKKVSATGEEHKFDLLIKYTPYFEIWAHRGFMLRVLESAKLPGPGRSPQPTVWSEGRKTLAGNSCKMNGWVEVEAVAMQGNAGKQG